jgi:hypothetical protein
MKSRIILKFLGLGAMSLILTLLSLNSYSQACQGTAVAFRYANPQVTAPNKLEFDIEVRNNSTGSPAPTIELGACTGGFTYPVPSLNGGTISATSTKFPAFAALNNLNNNNLGPAGGSNLAFTAATNQIRWAHTFNGNKVPLANGVWIPAFHIVINNTQNFTLPFTITPNYGLSSSYTNSALLTYCNGNPSSQNISSGTVNAAVVFPNPGPFTFQAADLCATGVTSSNVVSPACFGGTGSANFAVVGSISTEGTYTVDGGTAVAYSGNAFSVSNLAQGSHTIAVTDAAPSGCQAVSTIVNIGGPTSQPTNTTTASGCGTYTIASTGQVVTASGIYPNGTSTNTQGCTVTELINVTITPVPAQPTMACYETATFNNATCSWDVTGTMPAQPTLACYETASFNNGTCSWDVTGSMPAPPAGLACYQTATFNNATCSYIITGTMPAQPTLACYETASFNNGTCSWDVTGTMPAQPTK